MTENNWGEFVDELRRAGVEFDPGLTDPDIDRAETIYGFRFPPDLRSFMQIATPAYYDWHAENDPRIHAMVTRPLGGILFDVENGLWMPEWGTRPAGIETAKTVVTDLVVQAPRLIPIYGHRMMPDRPHESGNPVFSVHQTDIVHYGFDLEDYLRHEFKLPGRKPWPEHVRPIEFWDIDRFQEVRWREWTS